MRAAGPLLIAVLCLLVAGLSLTMAAPAKRLAVALVVSAPFALAAAYSLRKYLELRRVLALQAARPQPAARVDAKAFIGRLPQLVAGFTEWASALERQALVTPDHLEEFAVRHGDQIDVGSERFMQWAAAYGEAIRQQNGGRWMVGRDGEPMVVSSRFPFLRYRILVEAAATLETAEDLKWS